MANNQKTEHEIEKLYGKKDTPQQIFEFDDHLVDISEDDDKFN